MLKQINKLKARKNLSDLQIARLLVSKYVQEVTFGALMLEDVEGAESEDLITSIAYTIKIRASYDKASYLKADVKEQMKTWWKEDVMPALEKEESTMKIFRA